jgi:hypothetical protein
VCGDRGSRAFDTQNNAAPACGVVDSENDARDDLAFGDVQQQHNNTANNNTANNNNNNWNNDVCQHDVESDADSDLLICGDVDSCLFDAADDVATATRCANTRPRWADARWRVHDSSNNTSEASCLAIVGALVIPAKLVFLLATAASTCPALSGPSRRCGRGVQLLQLVCG